MIICTAILHRVDTATSSSAFARRSPKSALEGNDRWAIPADTDAATWFSKVAEVNAANKRSLQVAWMFSTGLTHEQGAEHLIAGSMIYVVTRYPYGRYAFDLTPPDSRPRGMHKQKPARAAQGVARCDVARCRAAHAECKIFFIILDGCDIAVTPQPGRGVESNQLVEINLGETLAIASLVVKKHLSVDSSSTEIGVHGWLTALDIHGGQFTRQVFRPGLDNDALSAPDCKAPYDSGHEPGATNWQGAPWEVSGCTRWEWVIYDHDSKLQHCNSGNPRPWNPIQRCSGNKCTSSMAAHNAGRRVRRDSGMGTVSGLLRRKSRRRQTSQCWLKSRGSCRADARLRWTYATCTTAFNTASTRRCCRPDRQPELQWMLTRCCWPACRRRKRSLTRVEEKLSWSVCQRLFFLSPGVLIATAAPAQGFGGGQFSQHLYGVAGRGPLIWKQGEPSPVRNPYAGNRAGIEQGRTVFHSMNCVGFHPLASGGGRGSPLTDTVRTHGSAPEQIPPTVSQGCWNGGPASGRAQTPESIWKRVAYPRTLSGFAADPVNTALTQQQPGEF